jgi:hypothetical protein
MHAGCEVALHRSIQARLRANTYIRFPKIVPRADSPVSAPMEALSQKVPSFFCAALVDVPKGLDNVPIMFLSGPAHVCST